MADCIQMISSIRKQQKSFTLFVAVGNKTDLESEREVSYSEAASKFAALSPPVQYFEVSAKTGQGVNAMFEETEKLWLRGPDEYNPSNDNH